MNTWTHLKKLTSLGPRPLGSRANQAAADYIRESFRSADLDVEEQPYPCTAWEHTATILEQDGERLDCSANAFSLPCDVTAPILPLASVRELETAPVKGKILLLYGDLARAPLSPKSWFLIGERDQHIIALLESRQPAAVLAPPTATDYFNQLTEDAELDLAAATISAEAALHLLKNPEKPVHLKIKAQRIPALARNIIGRTPGQHKKRLVICAHFDSKINTPGASDNASGVVALLTLAEVLGGLELPFGLEFVVFNGEEYLPMGDDEYLRCAEPYFGDILAAINMDGIGSALGTTSITMLAAVEELEAWGKAEAAKFPGVVWVDPWPESNHSTFAMRGIPAVALGAVGARGLAHSTEDTIDRISAAKLDEVVGLVQEIVKNYPH